MLYFSDIALHEAGPKKYIDLRQTLEEEEELTAILNVWVKVTKIGKLIAVRYGRFNLRSPWHL